MLLSILPHTEAYLKKIIILFLFPRDNLSGKSRMFIQMTVRCFRAVNVKNMLPKSFFGMFS